ncbi:Organic solvent tolerance protein [Cedecea neteri]|uniref:Organic solvent tolerance protein n=1 Tax=Cedecea neteri TaxID=158822 RepID=A0A2X2SWA8_9ENTR|nr:Organic solvent tolerance protein [Cedecea neteri]
MEFDYLPSDDEYKNEPGVSSDEKDRRWLFYWSHSGVMDQVWRFNIDYTKVSDSRYFNDFTSQYGSGTDGYATQKFSVGYANQNFDATLSAKQFQVFANQLNSGASSYRAEPQLDVNFYQNDVGPFDTRIYGQAVKFTNVNSNMPNATRLHLEPVINLPLSNGWASLNTETKLMMTHYQQDNLDKYKQNINSASTLENTVNRTLPQFKVDGKLIFDRDIDSVAGWTQTLEPRAQYLYVPYRNQSAINNYDSSLLQSDYSGLFRDRTYGGLDRIASANQVTTRRNFSRL